MDEATVRITIDAPKPYFLAKMTYSTAAIVDMHTVEAGGDDWWRGEVNGSGPYMLHQWSEGEVLILKRFDGYYQPSSLEYAVFPIHRRLPIVRQVEDVPTVVELEGGHLLRYMADEIDAVFVGSPNVDDKLSGQLAVFPQLNTFFVG